MKKQLITCLLGALMLVSCNKDEPINCYECQLKYAAFGHGTAKLDTLCDTQSVVELKEQQAFISNDSIQQSLECNLISRQ